MWIDETGRALTVALPEPWSVVPDWLADVLKSASSEDLAALAPTLERLQLAVYPLLDANAPGGEPGAVVILDDLDGAPIEGTVDEIVGVVERVDFWWRLDVIDVLEDVVDDLLESRGD